MRRRAGLTKMTQALPPLVGGPPSAPATAARPGDPSPYASKAGRAAYVDRRLAELFPNPVIPLDHKDAYTLLVAVMLSAHTTDRSVNSVTPELFSVADTPEKMMRVPVAEIQRIIRPVGLSPTKAKNLSEMARLLV